MMQENRIKILAACEQLQQKCKESQMLADKILETLNKEPIVKFKDVDKDGDYSGAFECEEGR